MLKLPILPVDRGKTMLPHPHPSALSFPISELNYPLKEDDLPLFSILFSCPPSLSYPICAVFPGAGCVGAVGMLHSSAKDGYSTVGAKWRTAGGRNGFEGNLFF